MKIAVVANTNPQERRIDVPVDYYADCDSQSTMNAIRASLEVLGHTTFFLEANKALPGNLISEKPDFVFNMAEGLYGDSREAQIPALLELLEIPYTGSRVLANAIALNKVVTKQVWQSQGLPVGKFKEITSSSFQFDTFSITDMEYPLFVKPSFGGTSMGVSEDSVVYDKYQLRYQIRKLLQEYGFPVIVEEFLPGREFTCTVIKGLNTGIYYVWPIVEEDSENSVTPGVNSYKCKEIPLNTMGETKHICPAIIPPQVESELRKLAIHAHTAIGCEDYSRVDMRMDKLGNLVLLEINLIPGLTPNLSDVCISAEVGGMDYNTLIQTIFQLAEKRWSIINA